MLEKVSDVRPSSADCTEFSVDDSPLDFRVLRVGFLDRRIKRLGCKPFAYVLSYLFHAPNNATPLGLGLSKYL
jgi:hypothetical protein